MPRVRRKAKRRRISEATQEDLDYLRSGCPLFLSDYLAPDAQDEPDEEATRELWETYRAELTYETPWKRPWAWWEFDAPERRRCINLPCHPFDNPQRAKSLAEKGWSRDDRLFFGKPACMGGFFNKDGSLCTDEFDARYELTFCYLHRLGLFNEQEQALWDQMIAEVKAGEDPKWADILQQHGIEV